MCPFPPCAQLCLVDHELRFTPAFLKAREAVRAGTLGALLCVSARVLFPVETKAFTWWADASLGGGALGAIGSHVIDAFRRAGAGCACAHAYPSASGRSLGAKGAQVVHWLSVHVPVSAGCTSQPLAVCACTSKCWVHKSAIGCLCMYQ